MRYRLLDANGDYTFGQMGSNFAVNSPAAVGQAILTSLKLIQGEWFLDSTAGVPYNKQILGKNTTSTYDYVIQTAILGVQGVQGIATYSSSLDSTTRALSVVCTVDTVYGQTTVSATFTLGGVN